MIVLYSDLGIQSLSKLIIYHSKSLKHVLLASNIYGDIGLLSLSSAINKCHLLENIDISASNGYDLDDDFEQPKVSNCIAILDSLQNKPNLQQIVMNELTILGTSIVYSL